MSKTEHKAKAEGLTILDPNTGAMLNSLAHDGTEQGLEQAATIAEGMAAVAGKDLVFRRPDGQVDIMVSKDAFTTRRLFGYSHITQDKWDIAFGKKTKDK